jgi:hypothetical protein
MQLAFFGTISNELTSLTHEPFRHIAPTLVKPPFPMIIGLRRGKQVFERAEDEFKRNKK